MDIPRRSLRSGASGSGSAVAGSSGGSGTSTQQSRGSRGQNVTNSAEASPVSPVEVEVEEEAEEESSNSSGSDSDDGPEYGDMHRLVLQGVMSAGYLDVKGVKKLFEESCRFLQCKVPAAEHLSFIYIQKVVREINERIKNFDMMIRSATCEISGEKYYVILVTMEKQIMKFQTFFTKVELDLFQKIINSVLRKHNNFLVPMNECINLGSELDSRFSKVNAEDFINKMIKLQYLAKVFNDKKEFELTLGFRAIREFETIFRESFAVCFGTCCLCKMILLNGLTCPHCPTAYHRACIKKYIKHSKKCVKCKENWENESSLRIRTLDGTGGKAPASTPETSQEGPSSGTTGTPGQTSGAEGLANTTGDEVDVDMPTLSPVPPKSSKSLENKETPTASTSSKDSSEPSTSQSSKRGKRAHPLNRIDSSSESD